VLDGEVLVADLIADTIQRFLPNGTHAGSFASTDSPSLLESDSNGNVYATSFGAVIAPRRFDSNGTVTQTFMHNDLDSPVGIDADGAGNVYIADGGPPGTRNLFKFASDGTFLNSISLGTISPFDLAIDEAGSMLYMADELSDGDGIKIFDISGAVPSLVASIATPAGASIAGMHFAAESGNILATNFTGRGGNPPRGLEYSPLGVLLREYFPTDAVVAPDITTFVPEPTSLVAMWLGVTLAWLNRRIGRGWSRT
jgi:DNA-binding beta-propeller fold protein YncE